MEAATAPLPESEVEPGECSVLIDPEPLDVTLRWSAVALCCVPPLKFAVLAGFAGVLFAGSLGRGELVGAGAGARVTSL